MTATSGTVAEVERLQDHFEHGPCGDAVSTTNTVVVDDLAAHRERWPKFAPAPVDRGLSAVLGIPMHVNGTTVGALNVYGAAPRRGPTRRSPRRSCWRTWRPRSS